MQEDLTMVLWFQSQKYCCQSLISHTYCRRQMSGITHGVLQSYFHRTRIQNDAFTITKGGISPSFRGKTSVWSCHSLLGIRSSYDLLPRGSYISVVFSWNPGPSKSLSLSENWQLLDKKCTRCLSCWVSFLWLPRSWSARVVRCQHSTIRPCGFSAPPPLTSSPSAS